MNRIRRRTLLNLLKGFDILVVATVFVMTSLHVDRWMGPSELLTLKLPVSQVLLCQVLLALWHGVFAAFGLYHSRRLSSCRSDLRDVLKSTTIGAALVWLLGTQVGGWPLDLFEVTWFWFLTTCLIASARVLLRFFLTQLRLRGRNLRNLVVVGINARTVDFVRQIERRPELGYRVLGFVDEEPKPLELGNVSRVADFSGFAEFLRNRVVDEVVIGLPVKSRYSDAARITALCQVQGIGVRVLRDLFESEPSAAQANVLDDQLLVSISTSGGEEISGFLKRFVDLVGATTALLLSAPMLSIIALFVKATSPGPVFFVQQRVGLNKRPFRMYKFRTMVSDAEKRQADLEHLNEADGAAFKIENDPRVTRFGHFLRRSSLDEVPQLINVLKGDMSLVGPRPLPLRDYRRFKKDWQRRRFSVRPGLTCLWQVSRRREVPFDEWMRLDMQYIDEWSLLLDLKILARTVPAIVRGHGAS